MAILNGSTKNRAEIFDREINNNAWIADHLKMLLKLVSIVLQ